MIRKISILLAVLVAFVSNPTYSADGDRCSPQIANNAAAASVCNPVCQEYGMVFAGNWSNDPSHPPVKACIDKGEGQAVCGCKSKTIPDAAYVSPTVQIVDTATPLQIPIGMKKTCMQGPDNLYASETCPIVNANGLNFWALSYVDNRVGMAIVGYDSNGNVVSILEKTGSRYIWQITLDATHQTIAFQGQSNAVITLSWDDLLAPQMVYPGKAANYVLWPTSTSGQASWTDGVNNYGTTATFGTGTNQLLDPNIEHSAGKPLCAAKNQPWFDFGSTSVSSPYLTVTCTLPPVPGQPTYNVNMNQLLDAAVNDHSLMTALDASSTDDQLIAVAASKGYTITKADIAQSKGATPSDNTLSKRSLATSSSSCGAAGQPPCSQCTQEVCVYFPFNFCCIKESCSCQQSSYSCNSGLSINKNGICTAPETCASNQICKAFLVFQEYNDNGTKDNGVCESWLRTQYCEKGIPNDALSAYEVIFKNSKAYYKSTDTLVESWTVGNEETLYVIDARDNKIYMVNVDGRYIQVRGSANCVGTTIPPNDSTAGCDKPRLTTHAGILMGSIAGLPTPNSEPGPTVQETIKVIGAGTIRVTNGDIQWITNDSGHFEPSQDNLKNSIQTFKNAGFPNFPPLGSCTYDFQPVAGKEGVYRQNATTNSHCEL